jgi:flavin reductase (DIM6/NTAB) family NADH-FMN oxidoreductase RutF
VSSIGTFEEVTMIVPDIRGAADLRRAYGAFPSGVTAVCALRDGAPVGLAASSFVSVSMDPPLVSICVQRTSATWPLLADRDRLGVSVLGADQAAACRQLAGPAAGRFTGLVHHATPEGAVLLTGAAAWLDCSLHDVVDAGDHVLALLRVEALATHDGVAPIVFQASRFHRLVEDAA